MSNPCSAVGGANHSRGCHSVSKVVKCSVVAPLLVSHVNTSYLQRLHVQTRSRLHHDDIGTVNGLLRGRVGSNNVYDVGRAPALLLGGFGETEEMLTHGLYKKRGEYTTKGIYKRGGRGDRVKYRAARRLLLGAGRRISRTGFGDGPNSLKSGVHVCALLTRVAPTELKLHMNSRAWRVCGFVTYRFINRGDACRQASRLRVHQVRSVTAEDVVLVRMRRIYGLGAKLTLGTSPKAAESGSQRPGDALPRQSVPRAPCLSRARQASWRCSMRSPPCGHTLSRTSTNLSMSSGLR